MAFSKKMVEDRKAWLSAFVPGTFLDQRAPRIPYRDFIHKARRHMSSTCSRYHTSCVCTLHSANRANSHCIRHQGSHFNGTGCYFATADRTSTVM